jgi:predicted RNA binding protein YcfA (HicA-like mRNA interferase family)
MPLSAKNVIKALENMGFEQAGREKLFILRHPDGRTTIVPVHSTQKSERE